VDCGGAKVKPLRSVTKLCSYQLRRAANHNHFAKLLRTNMLHIYQKN